MSSQAVERIEETRFPNRTKLPGCLPIHAETGHEDRRHSKTATLQEICRDALQDPKRYVTRWIVRGGGE